MEDAGLFCPASFLSEFHAGAEEFQNWTVLLHFVIAHGTCFVG